MHWMHEFQLFLFDFDGLLVNTEEIHFLAYQRMCEKYGFKLDWSFERYCRAAHYRAEGLREQIYHAIPDLHKAEPNWEVLYAYKKQQILSLLEAGAIQLMPGVHELLSALDKAQIKRCVVTHSSTDLVDILRRQHAILNSIPHWITREHYTHPKPHPEGYQIAIQKLADPHEKIIGFEDTPRGIEALMKTRAEPILISQTMYEHIPQNVKQFSSFTAFSTSMTLI